MGERRRDPAGTSELRAFLRSELEAIRDAWSARVRRLSPSQGLFRRRLGEFIPALVHDVANLVDAISRGEHPVLPRDAVEKHTIHRLQEGFDIADVVTELTFLRDTITEVWWTRVGAPERARELDVLDQAIDASIVASVERYAEASTRTMHAVDRISSIGLGVHTLDELLEELLVAFRVETPAVDVVAIMLREGDWLRTRAASGLDEDLRTGFSLPLGEGFAGRIAAEGRPLELEHVRDHPLVQSPALDKAKARSVYGVPLIDVGRVLGVAYMGSVTAPSFSEQDRTLFNAMVHRATAAIVQHLLREEAEHRAAALAVSEARFRATFDSAAVGIAELATDGSFLRVNRRYAELLGYAPDELTELRYQDVTAPDDLERNLAEMALLLEGRASTYTTEKRYIRKDGAVRWVELTVSAVPGADGKPEELVIIATDITRRRATEEALRASEQRMRLAIEMTRLGTWDWDVEHDTLVGSALAYRMLGLKPDAPLDTARFVALLRPEDRRAHQEAVRRALRGEGGGRFARDFTVIRSSDREERCLSTRARVIFDAHGHPTRMLGTVRDITEERRRETRLRFLADVGRVLDARLGYQETLERVAKLAVPTLADWCTVDILDRGSEMLGEFAAVAHRDPARIEYIREIRRRFPVRRDGSSPIARVIATGTPLWRNDPIEGMLQEFALGGEHLQLLRRVGVRSFAVVPLMSAGEVVGALSFATAESGRRFDQGDVHLFAEIGRSAGAAIEAARLNERTRRAVELRDQVLAVVSHDLRTPLQIVDMASTLLLRNPSVAGDPSVIDRVNMIKRAAARMERLISDLLDMSSIRQGRLSAVLEPCDLASILDEVVAAQGPLASEHGTDLRIGEVHVPSQIPCDRGRIAQLLANLVGNATKFCGQGDAITIDAVEGDGETIVSVTDTGPGIPPEDLERIFEFYWSGPNQTERGSGLGLFIARGIVNAHGGRIWVESRPGVGSRFAFSLPHAAGAGRVARPPSSPDSAA